jgi:KDO2-lipid IV(A) lauroyltransferase
METLLYVLARTVIGILQSLPLTIVARIGRIGGALFYWLDARHRKVALKNLRRCFGTKKSDGELRKIARENFKRIGENFCCAAKTASMPFEKLSERIEFVGAEKFAPAPGESLQTHVVAIGHFGNFELYARFGQFMPMFQCATTYRGLRQPSINRLMQNLREKSGCLFFERRTDAAALKAAMQRQNLILGLLADQHAGNNGLRIPFFGEECSTSAAPAIFALRYHCPLLTGICYRVGLAKWRIEAGDEIPTRENGAARSSEAIMADVNRAFENAIRRDPANWFWVHNRWKPRTKRTRISRVKSSESESESIAEP